MESHLYRGHQKTLFMPDFEKSSEYAILEIIDKSMPWEKLWKLLEDAYYSKSSKCPAKGGRPRVNLVVLTKIYVFQHILNLSDERMRERVSDSNTLSAILHLNPFVGRPPHRTTINKFRLWIEREGFDEKIFEIVLEHVRSDPVLVKHLESTGLDLRWGTIVDSTIIEAPSSTKNKDKSRDPEMHSSKKGDVWHFGGKLHIGTDWIIGLIHSFMVTPANVHDIRVVPFLLTGKETVLIGDSGHVGVGLRPENAERKVKWLVVNRPKSKPKGAFANDPEAYGLIESYKISIRSKVEHVFHIVKNLFGFRKTRFRGMRKLHSRACILFALANLLKLHQYKKRMGLC